MSYYKFRTYLDELYRAKDQGLPNFISPDVYKSFMLIEKDVFDNKELFVDRLNLLIDQLRRNGNIITIFKYCNDRDRDIFRTIELNKISTQIIRFNFTGQPMRQVSNLELSKEEVRREIEKTLPGLNFPPKTQLGTRLVSIIRKNKELEGIFDGADNCNDYPELVVYIYIRHSNIGFNINQFVNTYIHNNRHITNISYTDFIKSFGINNKYYKYKLKYLKLKYTGRL